MSFKELLKSKKIKQRELAIKLNVQTSTVSMWATNNSKPDIFTVAQISEILSVTKDEVLDCFVNSTSRSNAQ